ncbi:hypothetical protein T11_7907 [Trichinella zimbabwensis]|uniref:Uncharacterized protein n=1 Tax=Trichinella zimbabwensis TaxID=268475 RepID=A0A0V1H4K2_9BILA|nr:hypothetical protein T11_7907 [Trichinella zimbabwensis]
MNFQPLIVAGKKLNENAYRELPQDSMNTGKKNEKSCSTSDSSVHSSLQFEAASSTSNLSAAIKQERQLAEARQAVRRRKTFAYDGDISTEIHLTFGISSTEMPSKLEECLQPHSTSSGQSLGHGTMKTRSGSNVSSHKKRSENESEKNLTSRSGRFDVQANVSDKVVGASEANYQKINSAAEGNKDVDGAVLIESNSSKGNAVASENPSYALRNSGRKKSISAQFSSDKKVENSASKTSNSVPSTVNDTVQQFSTSISALNFDEKCSSSFEKAVIKERAEANARQLARRRKTLKSGSNYDEIHLTKEMMQTTSSSNITYTTRSNSRTKSADVNSKAHGTSVDEDDRMHTSAATHRTRKSNSLAKADDSNSKTLATSNLVEEEDRMLVSVATHRTRKGNSGAKSDDLNSKAPATLNLVDDDGRLHTSAATYRTRKSNSRAKSDDSNSKTLATSNLVEEDDRMLVSVATHRTRKSSSRTKSADFNSKAPATSNLVEEDGRMHTSAATHTTRKGNSGAKSDDFNSKAHVDDDGRLHTSVATRRTRKSNSRTKSGDSNSKALGTSNLVDDDGRMHTSVAARRTRKSNSRTKSGDSNSKALGTSNLVDDDGRMHTSVATRRTRKSNSRTKSDDLNSKAHGSSNLVEDDGIHSSVAMHTRGKSNSRAKSATSSLVEEVDRMRTSIASNRTRKSNSRAKSGDFNSKTPDTSNLVDEDDRMHTSLSSALTVIENSKREADNSNLALWNATSESKLAVALPVQDRVFEKTPTTRSKRRCFPFSSTPSTNFKKAEMPDVPFLGDLSTIISLRAPEHEKIKKIRSGMKSRAGSKNCVSPELVESVPRVDCNNDDPTKTALIASSILENSEKIANNGSLSNEAANGKQTIPEVVPAHSFHSPVPSNVQRKNKHKKPERRGKKNIKRYPAFSTPNLQSGKGDVMKYPAFSSSELSSITSLPTKDTNSFKSMDCNKKSNQSKAVVAKNSLSQSSRKQRLSCESTEKQSKRASLKSGSQVCDIAAAGNDFDDIEAVNSENVQQSDAESCQTSNADSDQVMKRSSGCKEIEEIDSKRLADLVSAMSENASVTPISCFKKPSGSLDNTAILKRFGVDSECDDVLYEEEIDELPANRKQSASEKEESEEKMSLQICHALPLSSDNLSVGQKRSSTAILHSKTKEVSSENGTLSPLTSFHSETECSESFYPFNARCKKLRKLSISTEGSTSTFLNGSENDSGIVTPKRHPRSTTLFEQLMRRRISSAMNKAASSTERSSSQQNVQSSSTSMNDTSIKHYYENGTPNVSLGYASELPTPKINWGDLRTKTPNVRRSNRTRIPTLRRQLGESVVYRYVNGLPEVERVIHGTVMGKVFLRYGAANSAALVEARRRRRRFLEYRRKMKKLQRERNEALRKRRLSAKESQSSVMGYC